MLDPKWQSKYKDEDWAAWLGLKKFYLGNRQYDIDRIYPNHKAQINYLLDKYYVTNSGNHTSVNDKNLYTKLDMLQRTMKDLESAESSDDNADKWHEQMDLEQDPYDVFKRNEEIKQNRTIASRELMINRISSRDAVEDVAKYWDKASKEFGDYYRQLKKKKKKSSISLRDLTKIANDGEHEWNCLMIDYPEDMASKVIAWGEKNIDDDNLYIDKEDPSYGRKKHIHTTISYGIKPDIDFEKIKDECKLKPLNVSLGEVSKFDTDDKFDVIKITVEGSDLHDLHKKIEDEIGCPGNTYPDYKPHLTIAYVKKGSCDNLLGSAPFKGEKFILNNYDYSQAGKENKHIKHTANYIPNPKSTMPSPIKRNFDYTSENWIDRVEYETKKRQKARNKRKAAINLILK